MSTASDMPPKKKVVSSAAVSGTPKCSKARVPGAKKSVSAVAASSASSSVNNFCVRAMRRCGGGLS